MTWRRRTQAREQGTISLMLAVLAVSLLVAIGLVVDGGRYITAAQLADNAAGEAGRAAGQHITSHAVTGQAPQAHNARAGQAAQDYLAAAGVDGTVTVNGDEITITTTVQRTPVLLSIAGVSAITATGTATVRLTRG
ncbi:MAG: pilus assembly protein TadG-related protein [bacterium]